jgi:general secretion pathway protein G
MKRKAFTLVELLIVIVIIGILAGSLLLVMGSGKAKAEATKIVSDMRVLKAAAVMYFYDNSDWPADGDLDALKPYLDREPDAGNICSYSVANDGTHVFIGATLTNCDEKTKSSLASMAEETGLLDSAMPLASLPSGNLLALAGSLKGLLGARPAWAVVVIEGSSYYSGGEVAYMHVADY